MTTSIRTLDDLKRMALFTAALLQMFLGCHLLPFRHILIEHTQPQSYGCGSLVRMLNVLFRLSDSAVTSVPWAWHNAPMPMTDHNMPLDDIQLPLFMRMLRRSIT